MAEAKIADELTYETEEKEADHALGTLISEENSSRQIVEPIDIPLGYRRDVIINGEEETAYMSIKTPAKIEPDFYYPVVEWRITPEQLLEQDYLPQWIKHPVMINGQTLMEEGRELLITYYVIRAELDMSEEEDGHFFLDPPFSRDEVVLSDIGLPMIKGSDVTALRDAAKLLGGQSGGNIARRRVG